MAIDFDDRSLSCEGSSEHGIYLYLSERLAFRDLHFADGQRHCFDSDSALIFVVFFCKTIKVERPFIELYGN